MIEGHVSACGVPEILLNVKGTIWSAVVDTGFNGDLELPNVLRGHLSDRPAGRLKTTLAGGQVIEEDAYVVEFPFNGESITALATFHSLDYVLIGTNLLREYSLQISFVRKTVRLHREDAK